MTRFSHVLAVVVFCTVLQVNGIPRPEAFKLRNVFDFGRNKFLPVLSSNSLIRRLSGLLKDVLTDNGYGDEDEEDDDDGDDDDGDDDNGEDDNGKGRKREKGGDDRNKDGKEREREGEREGKDDEKESGEREQTEKRFAGLSFFNIRRLWELLTGASRDNCIGTTSGSRPAIGCVANSGCCQYGLSIGSLCPGEKACCYTRDICNDPPEMPGVTTTTEDPALCLSSDEMTTLEEHLIKEESIELRTYDAKPGPDYDPTICVGFSLVRSDARSTFASVLPNASFDDVLDKKQDLTKDECMELFRHDLKTIYIPRSELTAGAEFCDFPTNVKTAVISAVYRGDLSIQDTPTTVNLIRDGKWCKVKDEYLDHNDYKTCTQRRLGGICIRMDWNAAQFESMCVVTTPASPAG